MSSQGFGGRASVCQAPELTTQNCGDPESRTVLWTSDSTSPAGVSIKFPGDPAKDLPPGRRYFPGASKPTHASIPMQTSTDKVVVLLTKGTESEISSVVFTIANGALTAGMKASVFLTSTAIDLVSKGGQKMTQVAPLDSVAKLIEDFQARGGAIWAGPPCVKPRGYQQADLLDGVVIVGASAMFAEGAATLSF